MTFRVVRRTFGEYISHPTSVTYSGDDLVYARSKQVLCTTALAMLVGGIQRAPAQVTPSASSSNAKDPAAARVVIERVAVELRDPARYQVPLELKATRSMVVRATTAGTIATILVRPGEETRAQSEVLRLDSQISQLLFQNASSEFKIAQLEHDSAAQGVAKEIAASRLAVARNNLDIAQMRLDQMVVKAPYDCTIFRVYVAEGEYVTPGMPLMDLADSSQLEVEVPIERGSVKVGDAIELDVEAKKVTGTVQAILPPSDRLTPLRDLFVSVAAARVVIDNSSKALQPGQAVYSPMVPRHPVVEVPNSALVNTPEGKRKVQIIREGFVRDMPVVLLGAVGELHSFVSGRFSAGDELIVRSSEQLVDGTWVRPQLEVLKDTTPQQQSQSTSPATRTGPGF